MFQHFINAMPVYFSAYQAGFFTLDPYAIQQYVTGWVSNYIENH